MVLTTETTPENTQVRNEIRIYENIIDRGGARTYRIKIIQG